MGRNKNGGLTQVIRNEILTWPRWWAAQNFRQKIFPVAVVALYWTFFAFFHRLTFDHLRVGSLILVLSYAGPKGRTLLRFLTPLILTGIVYDSQRFYSDLIRGPVHVQEPYLFDKYFFGIKTDQGILTPNEWWQLHTHPILDFISGFLYLTFILIFVLIAAYFQFWVSRTGTPRMSAGEIRRRAPQVMWAFFWVNVIGYTTYYWYAAAPPWYVALYGLGPAQMGTPSNVAGCARFDQLLGTHFFSQMYGRSADVFGAIPSLHIAYPLQAVYYAFLFGAARWFSVLFYLAMCFSAVYLNHHYMLDLIWGSVYAIVICLTMDWYYERSAKQALNFVPKPFSSNEIKNLS